MRLINLNSSDEAGYVYIGREVPEFGLAGSALGNRFTVEEYGRALAIELYRQWLWEKIEAEDKDVLSALSAFDEDSVLACWCTPEGCHGDVVMAAWELLRENQPDLLNAKR